ncbi:MAG: DNA alkylation repair protein [Luteimonas sp.]|nr:DNA alkylation repair protein [Luteimonas sp.]
MKATSREPTSKPLSSRAPSARDEARPLATRVDDAQAWLKRHATKANRDGMARYAIPSDKALGVAMRDIQALAKQLGRDHALALALWETDIYEARLLTAYVDEPDKVTAAQMDRWCRDFDNWAICDTLCFALWDRTPHAWKKVPQWAGKRDEFVKRAGFVLLACLALHDKTDTETPDAKTPFLEGLKLIEREATDARNFVKKAVNWALRAIGGKRNPILKAAALDVAARLAASDDATARWVGKDALRQLGKEAARKSAAKQAPSRKVPAKQARAAK